ncbi:efflux RND transporter periplasmic adaptor subunit [Sporosarcina sp. CAU 1771]
MNKFLNISVAIAVSSFLAVNLYLLFGEKSIISKSVYVNEYERMTSGEFSKQLEKEGFIAPVETYTVYVGEEDTVDSWLVTEGDVVQIGDELAILNVERSESQKNIWESEYAILKVQEAEVAQMILDLQLERTEAKTNSAANSNKTENVTETAGETTVEVGLNVDVGVDVVMDGGYAQAIATVEQELADINRQLVILEAQLAQNPLRPAIISPVEGVVSNVTRFGPTLAIEVNSSQKEFLTYAVENEWKELETGLRVLVRDEEAGDFMEGTVKSVSTVPAKDGEVLDAFKKLTPEPLKLKNPLAYYEVRIPVEVELDLMPYGQKLYGSVILDHAVDAVSVKKDWVYMKDVDAKYVTLLDDSGRPVEVEVVTPFDWLERSVLTEGPQLGDVAIDGQFVHSYDYAPRVFMPFPSYMPKKNEWRTFGWRNYLRYMTMN